MPWRLLGDRKIIIIIIIIKYVFIDKVVVKRKVLPQKKTKTKTKIKKT
jgi:hypothetical protein